MDEPKRQLVRGLTATDTTALVVGTVIGSGVFLKTAVMTQDVGTPALVMAAWVAAGLLSLAGALTYAELGAMLPAAGGEYVYLKKSYGETAAFLFGWQRFIVAGSASIASLGSGRYGRGSRSRLRHVAPGGEARGSSNTADRDPASAAGTSVASPTVAR